MSQITAAGLPTIYNYEWPAQAWILNNQTWKLGGISYEAKVSATTRQAASAISHLTAGAIHVELFFSDSTSVTADVSYADLIASANVDSNDNLSCSIMDIENESPGLVPPPGKTITGATLTVTTPFASGTAPTPDAASFIELAVQEYQSHDPNHFLPGGYHPLASHNNTAGTITTSGLSVFVYDTGQVVGFPSAMTIAVIKLSLAHTSGSAFVPTGGGVVVIDFTAAITPQDVAVVGAATVNAQPASTFTAGTPVNGVLPLQAKASGMAGNAGVDGTLLGELTIVQLGANTGPQGLSLLAPPCFASQRTQVDWNSGLWQKIVLKSGLNYVDFINAKEGVRCQVDILQPSSGSAGTADWGDTGGPVIKFVGLSATSLSAVNGQRNQLIIQYNSNYNSSGSSYVAQLSAAIAV